MNDPWFLIHNLEEKKKTSNNRRCLSAEKTRSQESNVKANFVNDTPEPQKFQQGPIQLNQASGNIRISAVCNNKSGDIKTPLKANDPASRKRCQTPTQFTQK